MNQPPYHLKTTTASTRRQARSQLPLALTTLQARECIPNEVRMKCLPLWRELLQTVVLKEKIQNGGSHE